MSTRMPGSRIAFCVGIAAAWGPAAHEAHAQSPTLDPSGQQAPEDPGGAPPDPYAAPAPRQPLPAQRGPAPQQGEGGQATGYYHYDGAYQGGQPARGNGPQGPVPEDHEVNRGDTLWDISGLYFDDPFEWPRLWSLNPQITNPHWIYPGDVVALRDGAGEDQGGAAAAEPEAADAAGSEPAREPPSTSAFTLRQIAFVDRRDLEMAASVTGAPTERQLLAEGDTVYLEESGAGTLEVGHGYAIYAEREKVTHPETGETVGAYVKVLGELEVTARRDGEQVQARITDSIDVVERGARVGPLQRRFKSVEATPPEADLRATIVGTIELGRLVGQRQLVVIDRGKSAGVAVGNPLYVVRRGDAFAKVMGPYSLVGQNESGYPARIIGQVLVVDAGPSTSLGMVTTSAREVGVGDRLMMKAQ